MMGGTRIINDDHHYGAAEDWFTCQYYRKMILPGYLQRYIKFNLEFFLQGNGYKKEYFIAVHNILIQEIYKKGRTIKITFALSLVSKTFVDFI